MFAVYAKSILHNIGVLIVSFGIAFLGASIDWLLGVSLPASISLKFAGIVLLTIGFLVRVWATAYFYAHQMRIISLQPQRTLLTSGPYRFSRNPLYLGGNVFMFFGAALVLESPTALIFTAVHLPLIDLFIRREERQLASEFGEEWQNYQSRVRRWI